MNPRAAMIHRVMESNLFPRIRLSGCRFAINANRVLIIRKSDHQPCFGHVLASTRWPIPRWKWAILGSTLGGTHRYARSCVLRVQNIILDGEEIADEKWNGHIERIFEANRENVRLTRLRPVIERPSSSSSSYSSPLETARFFSNREQKPLVLFLERRSTLSPLSPRGKLFLRIFNRPA